MTATGAAFPIMCASEMESSAASAFCQSIKGEPIDKSVSDLLLQTMISMALDVALTVQQEIHTRLDEVDRMRHKQVERARYEADLANVGICTWIRRTVSLPTHWKQNGTTSCAC